ncbi:MAG: PAS domain-containing protein [Dehalococcoidia bacterium]|nr:PAS domain-containing protein [Dehalococcoidia bacterium]
MSEVDGLLTASGATDAESSSGPRWQGNIGGPPTDEAVRVNEERRLAQAAAGMGTWDWDIVGGNVRWSPELEKMHGFEPGTFDGTFDGFLERVLPDDRQRLQSAIEKASEDGEFMVEFRVRHRDGSVHWLSGHGRALFDEQGRPYRIIGVGLDITNQKAIEAALRESEARFRSMANSVPVFIWIADASRGRTWFNRTWLEFTGRTLEQDAGFGWLELVHPADRERYLALYHQAFDRQEPFELEYRLRKHTGEYCWMLARARPLDRDEFGSAGFVGLSIDISKRKHAEQHLQILSDAGATLTTSLDYRETPARLVEITVPAFADWCSIVVRAADGRLQRVASAHRDPSKLEVLQHLAELEARQLNSSHPVAEILEHGVTRIAPHVDAEVLKQLSLSPEHLALLEELDVQSVIGVPLVARGRTVGALVGVRTSERDPYDQDDASVAEELARRAALAMDNARLFADQQRANDALQLLADAGTQLAASLDFDETLANLARLIVPRFADWCAVDVVEADGSVRHVVIAHKDPAMVEFAREMQARYSDTTRPPTRFARRLRSGEPILVPEISDELLARAARNEEHFTELKRFGFHSLMAVPLTAHGRILGAIGFVLSEGTRQYDEVDFAVAKQLGHRAGLVVANSRLFMDSQRIEAQLLRANESLRIIADVGAQLGASLEYEDAMRSLARLPIPNFADFCWVDVVESDGKVRRAAIEARDEEQLPLAQAIATATFREGQPPPKRIIDVVRTGEAQLYEEVTEQTLELLAVNKDDLEAHRQIKARSLMYVPLKARGRVLGALTFVLAGGDRRYSRADLALAEDIALRSALFIDNARLYTDMQQTEMELRRANEAKDEFLSMMSHELRTPLTVINGGARILRARGAQLDEATRGSIINDIEQESDRLFRMVENLLAMAHIEFTEDVSVEPVLAQRLLERVIEGFQQRRPDRPVELEVEPGLAALAAEPTYLEQVIRNLLSNADKYSPHNAPITINVARDSDGSASIRVLDRGVGIEPAEAERIFERFYRSEKTSKLVGGSGVGLALCKRLIEAMSGRMWARPRTRGGLEVGFTLPLYEESN